MGATRKEMLQQCGLLRYKVPTPHYNRSLPTYVLVLGVEGSGHHLIAEFASHLFCTNKVVRYLPGFHLVGNRAAFVDRNVSEIKQDVGLFLQSNLGGKGILFDTQESFPAGGPYRVTRHPEVQSIAALDGVVANVRFVTLLRSPIMALVSQHRRFGHKERKDPALEAAVTAHELTWLQRLVEEIPTRMNLLLPYPLMKMQPEETMRRLGIFLQCQYKLRELKPHPSFGDHVLTRRWKNINTFFQKNMRKWKDIDPSNSCNVSRL